MRQRRSRSFSICGLMLVVSTVIVGSTEQTGGAIDDATEIKELMDGGVWKFTCDEYCAYCGCVGEFQDVQNKCVCSCQSGAADLNCLEDVKQTIQFLGLNYTLEIREFDPARREDVEILNIRPQRQTGPMQSPGRRVNNRRIPRPGREPRISPSPVRPHRRNRERRPFRRTGPLAANSP
ncbi:uncharacterized protein LOC134214520 [Armigeres subalbatus]|uniref:uncharacterized protein LOC134214520 n=1 Tax=Armigeres subalbatus TaxID=124917 RepID=UPI002ED603F7